MKPILKKVIPKVKSSYIVRTDAGAKMKNAWHYHAECELVYIKKSTGTWLVGDSTGNFESGDIFFLGGGVPHSFQHQEKYLAKKRSGGGEALVALFSPSIFGKLFLNLPESKDVKELLELGKSGIKIKGDTQKELSAMMEELVHAQNGRRLITLLNILQIITERKDYEFLATEGYSGKTNYINNNRLNLVINYTYLNFQKQITIEEVASLVNMGGYSFRQFFKEKTQKTYFQFLTGVRIGQACKFLIEDNMQSARVANCCGFGSISSFNKYFKIIKKKSPQEFKKIYLDLLGNRKGSNPLEN